MYYGLEREFPDFFEMKCVNPDMSIGKTNLLRPGRWSVIFFYPKDFTFVCPTEIVDFNNHQPEFDKLGADVYGVSPDNEYCKLAWRNHDPQLQNLNVTLVADAGNQLSGDLGITFQGKVPYRVTYIVDPKGFIQYIGAHGIFVGRNAAEVLRVLDACQQGEQGNACPAARPVGGSTL